MFKRIISLLKGRPAVGGEKGVRNTKIKSVAEEAQDTFNQAFELFANKTNLPNTIRKRFCSELKETIDDPRAGLKVAAKWLGQIDGFYWNEGVKFLQQCQNKRGTEKQVAELLSRCVISKYRVEEQWKRVHSTIRSHPYLLLEKGPVLCDCPIHGEYIGHLISVDDPYWQHHPLRETVFCHCRVRQVSRREYERLLRDGIQDLLAPPILDPRTGRPTGHREERKIPAKIKTKN